MFPLGGCRPTTLLTMAKVGTPAGQSGPLVMEVDGLRPGPSVVQVMTGNPREARQSIRVSKSVPWIPRMGRRLT